MKLKFFSIVAAIGITASNSSCDELHFDKKLYDAGSTVFDSKCLSCHIKKDYTFEELGMNFMEKNKILNLKAPVLSQLSLRLKSQLGDKSDREFQLYQVSDYIKDYANNPDKSKGICMEMVLESFETMPSMKGQVSNDQFEKIGYYMYWYDIINKKK